MMDEPTVLALFKRYRAGEKGYVLAMEAGVHWHTLYRRFKRYRPADGRHRRRTLSAEQVLQARRDYDNGRGGVTVMQLAKAHGVGYTTMWSCLSYQTYRYIRGERHG